jgi:hypothetical protein
MSKTDKIRNGKQSWAESIGFTLNNRGEPIKIVNDVSLARIVNLTSSPDSNVTNIKNTTISPDFTPSVGTTKIKSTFTGTKNKFEAGINRVGVTQFIDKKDILNFDPKTNPVKVALKLEGTINNTSVSVNLSVANSEVNPVPSYTVKQEVKVAQLNISPEATFTNQGVLTASAVAVRWVSSDASSTNVRVGLSNLEKAKAALTLDINQLNSKTGIDAGIQLVVGNKGVVSAAVGFRFQK